jgi:hypothetical protein
MEIKFAVEFSKIRTTTYTERVGIHTLQLLGAVDKFIMHAEFVEKSRRIDQAH